MMSALLFDFGGTLDGPTHWLDRFLRSYRAAGLEIGRDQLDSAFSEATSRGYRATKVLSRFGLKDLVRFLVGQQIELLLKSGPEEIRVRLAETGSKGRFRLVEEITGSFVAETTAALERNRSVIKSLKPRYRIGVVSNFYGNLNQILSDAGFLKDGVGAVADSSAEGIFKPDPRLFRVAIAKLKAVPEAAVMVGDSIDKDCAPAKSLGMRTVWYRPEPSDGTAAPRDDQAGDADFTIRSLDELVAMKFE